MRVFEIAKKIGIPTKEMMALLKRMGIKASNHMSALEESDIQAVMKGMEKSSVAKGYVEGDEVCQSSPSSPARRRKEITRPH
ncbi:MAG: translation initiation factor IF-2 N-terminal domain-containing protein [Candidatus Manganitrophus sp.]|nr:translation initiation factor IF-2 N-terminal domain-containing protein [Candidatus Manganitrophus sp.]